MSEILSQSERDSLAKLVADVERTTAGELVTVVVHRSAAYAAFRIGWAAGLALVLANVVHLVWPDLPVMELLGGQAFVAISLAVGLGWSPLLRLILPRWVKQQAVDQHAKRLFLELGVTETRDRSGVLIFLSEFERRVVILGDRGIHEHLGMAAWEAHVAELIQSIRAGKAAAGLRTILSSLGEQLAAKFPPRPDDIDELPNAVVTDEPHG